MRYLFGDSSESALETNYLAFLREVIDFGVLVLQADAGIAGARERRVNQLLAVERAARAVEELGARIHQQTEGMVSGDDPVNRCAAAIARVTTEVVTREAGRARARVPAEIEHIDTEITRWQGQCATALSNLLGSYDLPDAIGTLTVRWTDPAYEARLVQEVLFGAQVTLALDVPDGSMFARTLAVEQITGKTAAHALEPAESLEEITLVPQSQLGGHRITKVVITSKAVAVNLRTGAGDEPRGYDVTVLPDRTIHVEPIGHGNALDDYDLGILREITTKLEAEVVGLRANRRILIGATLDGKPLATDQPPRAFLHRLIGAMAPVVREIAAHSMSSGEFVLKRLVGDHRREEVFLSRAELMRKIEQLPVELRHVFAPFGLLDAVDVDAHGGGQVVDLSAPEETSIVIEAELPPSAPPRGKRSSRRNEPPPPPPRRAGSPSASPALGTLPEASEPSREGASAPSKDTPA